MKPWLPYRHRDRKWPTRALGNRRRRKGGHWNVLVGLLLCGLAGWYIANPDYPVVPEPSPTSAKPRFVLLPVALTPIGQSEFQGLEFKWLWGGPKKLWELVLLDAAMEELVTVRDIPTTALVPEGELLKHLRVGGRFHWYVAYSADGETYHSLPIPLVLPER